MIKRVVFLCRTLAKISVVCEISHTKMKNMTTAVSAPVLNVNEPADTYQEMVTLKKFLVK